jgi:hypothetical protein
VTTHSHICGLLWTWWCTSGLRKNAENKAGQGVNLTTHVHLTPRSRICGVIPSLFHMNSWRTREKYMCFRMTHKHAYTYQHPTNISVFVPQLTTRYCILTRGLSAAALFVCVSKQLRLKGEVSCGKCLVRSVFMRNLVSFCYISGGATAVWNYIWRSFL